ncbi:MAG: UvrD-helicase domain-containing protein [Muribaculaceae bacterium]|nr:UvrD-helicase domain-containing protein [Muribaculaceae bacterium]
MLTIYKASAGSGKTYNLTLQYLIHLLGRKITDTTETDDSTPRYVLADTTKSRTGRHGAILAITFTNKATDEMKRRIIDELATLAGMGLHREKNGAVKKSNYIGTLTSLFGCTEGDLEKAARRALYSLLFDFQDFNVSTIDAFFQNVLRTFARELELPTNYEVAVNDEEVVAQGVNDMLDSINDVSLLFKRGDETHRNHVSRLKEWLYSFMSRQLEEGQSFNIFNRTSMLFTGLTRRLAGFLNENFRLNDGKIREYAANPDKLDRFDGKLAEAIGKLENAVKKGGEELLRLSDSLPTKGKTPAVKVNYPKLWKKWAEGEIKKLTDVQELATKEPDKLFNKWANESCSDEEIGEIMTIYCRTASAINRFRFYKFIRSQLFHLGLFGEMLRHASQYCREHNLVLLSDTGDFLDKIINEDDTPFVYERLGTRLRHFLIDEFQDTSMIQWKNLRPLLLESLAQNEDDLIIGDEKQCIYRFRNSDPDLINHRVGSEIRGRAMAVKERGSSLSENINWRSAPEVIRFNNSLFMSMAANMGLESTYGNVAQGISPKHADERGYVKLYSVGEDMKKDEFRETGLATMLFHIKRQLRAGYRPSDIAVLVRTRDEGSEVIRYLLSAMENPEEWGDLPKAEVMSAESLKVGESPFIRLVVSRLRLLVAPHTVDDHGRVSRPRKARSDVQRLINSFHNRLMATPEDAAGALHRALEEMEDEIAAKANADGGNEAGRSRMTDEALLSLRATNLERIVEAVINEAVDERTAEADGSYIAAFLDLVVGYMERGGSDLQGFLDWWDETGAQSPIVAPEGIDAISVMTIHKSKGLEFDCVHVPMLGFEMVEYSTPFKRSYDWYGLGRLEGFDEEIVPDYLPLENVRTLEDFPEFSEQIREYEKKQMVDNVNLAYVAFTRAGRELIVTYKDGDGLIGGEIASAVSGLTTPRLREIGGEEREGVMEALAALAESDGCDAGMEGCESVLTYGEPTKPAAKDGEPSAKPEKMSPFRNTIETNLLETVAIRGMEMLDWKDPRDRGTLLHEMMSMVRHRSDIDRAVRRVSYDEGLAEDQRREALTILERGINDKRVDRWFEGYRRALNESTILLDDEKKRHPDRVVWTADGFIDIIDYKFGEQRSEYHGQVRGYMKQLAAMGYEGIRGFVWYPETGLIEQVTAPVVQ